LGFCASIVYKIPEEKRDMPRFPMIGMSPDVWGPFFWTTMHIVSLGYSPKPSEKEQEAAIKFYESLAYTIPCPICREHYSYLLEKMPIAQAVGSRDDLVLWVFNVHNAVNNQLGKPEITFDQYIQSMTALSKRSSFSIHQPNIVLGLSIGAAAGIAAYYFYQKAK
jgi:hypothetical protein